MKIIDTKFKGLKIITQDKFKDNRGYLRITHNQKLLKKKNLYLNIALIQKKTHYVAFIFSLNTNNLNMLLLLKEKF